MTSYSPAVVEDSAPEKPRGIVLTEKNCLRVDAENSLVITRTNALRIPAEDFEVGERLAREALTLEALARIERQNRLRGPVSYSDRYRAGGRRT